jgi:cytohesin
MNNKSLFMICSILVIISGLCVLSFADNGSETNKEAEQHFEKAYELHQLADYDAAIEEFRAVINLSPNSAIALNAQYWIGQLYFEIGQFDTALSTFQRLIDDFPTSMVVPTTEIMIERVQQAQKNRTLFEAVNKGDIEQIKQLIANGADVNAKWGDTNTKQEKENSSSWEADNTPLYYAADSNKMDVVKLLVEAGANVNAGQWPPLPTAVGEKNMGMVEYLIDHGADVDFNDGGWTLLMESFSSGKEMVKLLIDRGADIHVRCEWVGGVTALHRAIRYSYRDIAELLIQRGLDVNAGPWTPLHVAADEKDRLEMTEFLIQKGADVNAKDQRDRTPLFEATNSGNKEVAELLIAKGANVNAKRNSGETPLHAAVTDNNKDLAELLISKDADVNAKNDYGRTPLHFAVLRANKDIVEVLIANKVTLDAEDKGGVTPLGLAEERGQSEIAELLRENGAKISVGVNETPLIEAIKTGNINKVQSLINGGADVNAKNSYGYTALHATCLIANRIRYTELLIAAGADVSANDKDGHTPLWHAQDRDHPEIVELLREHGAKE